MNYALMYTLSPIGTALNAVILVAALLAWGADPHRVFFWLAVGLFVFASAWLDLRAYFARRRLGLSAYEATAVMTDKIWGPSRGADASDEEAA